MRRAGAMLAASLAVVLLAGCQGDGNGAIGDGEPSASDVAGSTPGPVDIAAGKDFGTGTTHDERGTLLKKVGQWAGLRNDEDQVIGAVFRITEIDPDLRCTAEDAEAPVNGRFIGLEIEGETSPQLGETGSLATFNLHQAFELSFRFVEQMCIGSGRVSHSIIGHINYCRPFFPTLNPFSGYPEQESRELLMLLEYSYGGARYGEGFEVTEAQALAMRAGLDRFLKEVEIIFQKHFESSRALMERRESEAMDCGPEPTVDKAEGRDAKSLLEEIEKLKKRNFDTLIPNSPERKHYYLQIKTRGYEETNYMIANFIQLCIMALETDWDMSINNVEPEYCIREVLGLVLNMLPYSEMEFLDEINKLVGDGAIVE